MACPLLMLAVIIAKSNAQFTEDTARGLTACGDWCAWWDEVEDGRCAILSLVGSLDDIAVKLMHIDDKMKGEK